MIHDEVTDKMHPDFCAEDCNVGFAEMDARHRSSALLASRGGPLADKASRSRHAVDVVPSVRLEQHSCRDRVDVVLAVNTWITDREGWYLPGELEGQGAAVAISPERAEHLAELLVEQARAARAAMAAGLSATGSAA